MLCCTDFIGFFETILLMISSSGGFSFGLGGKPDPEKIGINPFVSAGFGSSQQQTTGNITLLTHIAFLLYGFVSYLYFVKLFPCC